ncbi:MAG: cytidine deaminase [Elusimicrobiales bacterium]|nr:cytidine deaminase [Elusimicrobiales bacterium]MCK5358116.1 cytidine deaminase [Elusimicrobiales bacterium]
MKKRNRKIKVVKRKNWLQDIRKKLINAAKIAQKKAYCPYSRYPVGAAALMESGKIYTGCNIENASFGLSCCAERTAIFNAIVHGEKKLRAMAIVAKSAKPCGACRQVIIEFALKDTEIIFVDWQPLEKKEKITYTTAAKLLPKPFNPSQAGL